MGHEVRKEKIDNMARICNMLPLSSDLSTASSYYLTIETGQILEVLNEGDEFPMFFQPDAGVCEHIAMMNGL
jgi:hypothetical protein